MATTTMTGDEVSNLVIFWRDIGLINEMLGRCELNDLPADDLQLMHDYFEGIWAHPYVLYGLRDLINTKRTQRCSKCKKTKTHKDFYSRERNKVLKTCASCLDEKRWRDGRRAGTTRSYKLWKEHVVTKYNSIPMMAYNPRPTPEYCQELKKLRQTIGLEKKDEDQTE